MVTGIGFKKMLHKKMLHKKNKITNLLSLESHKNKQKN